MKALITGASSGLGKEFARLLSKMGYDLILVARRKEKLEELREELLTNVDIIPLDLSDITNIQKLYSKISNQDIDIVINNAGFGIKGEFVNTNLDDELELIDLNIKAVHILTKLFLKKFVKKDKGYILNVASMAGFTPGPLMASYYASKAYVLNLTKAINGELKKNKSNVYIGVLCPGPVSTEFEKVAKVQFKSKHLSSTKVVKYTINKMFKKKTIIIPGILMKLYHFCYRFIPTNLLNKLIYNIQK